MPTLIMNINKHQWNTSAEVFDKKFTDALKTMNTQSSLAGHTTTESFVEELSKHFKTNKICNNDKLLDCFSDIVYWGGGDAEPQEIDMKIIKTAKNFGMKSWGTNIVGVQFANGVNALIAYNPTETCKQDPYSNQITGQSCVAILYDTTGEKNPNTSGKDLRNNGNVAQLGSGCGFELNGNCFSTPFKAEPISKAECTSLQSELGIKKCGMNNDYWAGAVKACGGVSKMATLGRLVYIARDIYNDDSIPGWVTVEGLKMDPDKALSLGFKLTSSNFFSVWGEEHSVSYGYVQDFYDTATTYNARYRQDESIYTLCKE